MKAHLRRERHSVTDLKVHLVCVTKYRKKVLTAKGLENIEESFRSVAKKMNFQVLEFSGETEHVHAVLEYPPKLSISQMVNHLKGVSSRMYRKAGYRTPSEKHLWSPSYYASSIGGAPLEILMEYVRNQEKPS